MERPVWGIVLTAGSQEKSSPVFCNPKFRYVDEDGEFIYKLRQRIEPDLEGKLRLIPAIDALAKGQIDRILIAGGALNHDTPLARIYTDWAKRFTGRINREREKHGLASLHENSIVEVVGGVHTPSDLSKAKKLLEKNGWLAKLKIFSSRYQFLRRAVKDFIRDYQYGEVETIPSEVAIKSRHRLYSDISEKILTEEFVENMIERNAKIDNYPKFIEHIAAYASRAIKPEVEKHKKKLGLASATALAQLSQRIRQKSRLGS